ncbi:trimethylamine methyltransferase family protein [bacterium]|nr:trimethylamine methyltransferase family protein [bacterium]
MLTPDQVTVLRDRTLRMLAEVGLRVESDELVQIMLAHGCRLHPQTGRVRIPAGLVDELVAKLAPNQWLDDDDQSLHPYCGIDWTHWLMWTGQKEAIRERMQSEFLMSAFDCGPTTCYDYPAGCSRPVDTDIFITMKKLAQATPEIGYISTWYRQDVPRGTERIESLVLALQYTTKVDGIEAIDPAVIKYLVEIGEIMTGVAKDARYLAGSECLTSPLILDHRSAADMLARKAAGVRKYHMCSMPTIGVSSPVTIAASIVLGAAEVLGGLVAAFCLDPEGDLTGRMISTVLDMKVATAASIGPATVLCNLGVKELFDRCWGGHCWVEVFFSPTVKQPGLQAVYENFYGGTAAARVLGAAGIPYPGMGTLDNGGLGSPTQFILDMEIRKGQFALRDEIEVSDETLIFDQLCEHVAQEQEFLTSEHTLAHYRELWRSDLFPTDTAGAAGAMSEKRILDTCEERWRANVAAWEAPDLPENKRRELEKLVERAREELR